MNVLGTFVIICCLLYCSISWLLPKLLAWLFKRRYRVEVRIGRIVFPYLKLRDVTVTSRGFSVHVDEVGVRSSLLSSEAGKLLAVVLRDVRVNTDVAAPAAAAPAAAPPAQALPSGRPPPPPRLPPALLTLAQFAALHVYNIRAMVLRAEAPEWLVHAAAAELHADGSVVRSARSLLLSLSVVQASAKLLRHPGPDPGAAPPCLGEVSLGAALEASLAARGPLAVERLHLALDNPKAALNDGFYAFVRRAQPAAQKGGHVQPPGPGPEAWWRCLQPLLPKSVQLQVLESSVTALGTAGPELQGSLLRLQFGAQLAQAPGPAGSLQLEDAALQGANGPLLQLRRLTLSAKAEEEAVVARAMLDSLSLAYDHAEVLRWLPDPAPPSQLPQSLPRTELGLGAQLQKLLSPYRLRATTEAADLSAEVRLPPGPGPGPRSLALSCLRAKFAAEHGAGTESGLDRRWVAELLAETLACGLREPEPELEGVPLRLGVLLARVRQPTGSPDAPARLSVLLDGPKLQLGPALASWTLHALRCWRELRPATAAKDSSSRGHFAAAAATGHWALSSAGASALLLADSSAGPVALRLRVEACSVERGGPGRLSAVVDGIALASVETNGDAEEGAEVRRLRLSIRGRELAVALTEEVRARWTCGLHLRLLALWRAAAAVHVDAAMLARGTVVESVPQEIEAAPTAEAAPLSLRVEATGHLSLSAAGVRLSAEELVFTLGPAELSLSAPELSAAIAGQPMLRATGLRARRLLDCPAARLERRARAADGLQLASNRCWDVSIDSFQAVFPYQHSFAEAVQEELVSIVKWLRQVHRHRPGGAAPPSAPPLPADCLLRVREFLLELSDDPFEVRLRDNLELLEDEQQESLKRQQMLDSKVAELCKQHLLLPAGKVDELYASLSKKNAQIYVQRSRQMSRAAPARTRLFAWLITELEVLTLADPSLHGSERVLQAMHDMDPDSPWPEEGLRFSTLWCRAVSASCAEWKLQLRDFPQPLLHARALRLWGRLAGAEQMPTARAKREVVIDLGLPWGQATVERSMTALKFYHDLNCDVEHYSYAFGPCWEPVIAQCNMSFEKIIPPSRDPSPPLPFWDKMRLLLHGRLTVCVRQLTLLLHASLDPYNTTEEMELTWRDVAMDWTNAKVVFKGELNVYVRTASKYDDCRLLHLPNVRLTLKLQWLCLGDPCDHHSVMPCAPDKLPEYSSNQEHDSFRAFRSQNLNLSVALETRPGPAPADVPTVLLYGSTLRWFENLKLILSGVTRPTRRGALFGALRPRRPQLSRHYRRLHLLLGLHRLHVCYWMSFAMQRGCELVGGRISCSSEHTLTLVPIADGLTHRPRADWAVAYMNCELADAEMWLKSALQMPQADAEPGPPPLRPPVQKCYCLSVARVSYGREAALPAGADTPTHRLVVHDLKGAWTKSNRDVAFALFDAFVKSKQLKRNLSTEALKGFRAEGAGSPPKARGPRPGPASAGASPEPSAAAGGTGAEEKLQSGAAASMLRRLIAEADNKAVVFSDDLSAQAGEPLLQGRAACRTDDVLHKNWLIALVNSQVLLKGCDTRGYVILSAAHAEILQREHRPAWKGRTLVNKTTWAGSLDCMQYYATVSAGDADPLDENIMWLTVDNIQERGGGAQPPDVAQLVGSGRSVGGVVSETVGAVGAGVCPPLQLQRIVSRCRCEFFYAGYGDSSVDPAALAAAGLPLLPPPSDDATGPWERRETAVDAFTLMHHDLDVCTNSLQYAMILDVVNNLLLHVEPRRRQAAERLQRMRFRLQLHSGPDQRRPIQQLQSQVRALVAKLRRLERESYLLERVAAEITVEEGVQTQLAYRQESEQLERQVDECKELLNAQSEELDMMISCYKESQLSANQKLATMRGDRPVATVRANEIVFKHAQWRLTEADGQLGIADLVLSNFLYTKHSRSDDSGEHLLELGYVRMTNLLPNQVYTDVLSPTEIQSNMPVDRKRAVRVFCREKAPVGGISVKEHFEINVVPLTIGLTKKFFNTMLKFCFPERDPDTIEGEGAEDGEEGGRVRRSRTRRGKEASFYVPIDQKDDVEKMKERAEKNKLFIYIKIPEVPVKVSYKGNKDKNLEDIRDFSLVIPTLEYHNVTWTWLDLLLAMKNDSRRVILSQAIKQKLQIKSSRTAAEEGASPQEEDKARMLFGARLAPGEGRSLKRGVFKLSK